MKLKKNMSSLDSIIRLIVAVVIGVLYFTGVISGTLALILGIVAIIFVVTAFVRVCPLYLPFKFSTNKE